MDLLFAGFPYFPGLCKQDDDDDDHSNCQIFNYHRCLNLTDKWISLNRSSNHQ